MQTTSDTFTLPVYQNKGKARETGTFRAMTFQEAIELDGHYIGVSTDIQCPYFESCYQNHTDHMHLLGVQSHVWFLTQYGDARQAKLNGKVRTWKRDKTRIEIPCKYGLYEYFTLDKHDIEAGRLLVRID